MKKALISLLLGVTLVGGLVGCGNKPVVEDKEVNTPIVEEETLSKEDKINILIDGILTNTKVKYDNINDTIIIEHSYSYINFSDSEMIGYFVANPGSFDTFVNISNDDFEAIKETFGKGIPEETEIKILNKIGEYKILEYTEGTTTYRIDE